MQRFSRKSDSFSAHLSKVHSLIQQEQLNSRDIQRPMVQMISAAPQATSAELADAVAQLTKLMRQLSLMRAAFLAVGCGALIERGAPPEIAADTIVAAARSAFEKVDPADASSVAV
jgi:hypothetical protein